jgi:hypothetical protein
MNKDELKLRMDLPRYEALPPREKYLLNLEDADRQGTPRLVLASTFGDLEMVKSLISEGVDLNATSSRDMGLRLIATPSSGSAENVRDLEMLKSLISEETLEGGFAVSPGAVDLNVLVERVLEIPIRLGPLYT